MLLITGESSPTSPGSFVVNHRRTSSQNTAIIISFGSRISSHRPVSADLLPFAFQVGIKRVHHVALTGPLDGPWQRPRETQQGFKKKGKALTFSTCSEIPFLSCPLTILLQPHHNRDFRPCLLLRRATHVSSHAETVARDM